MVGEVDRVTEPETPNRHAADTGPLGELVGDGLLKELLENKTIRCSASASSRRSDAIDVARRQGAK